MDRDNEDTDQTPPEAGNNAKDDAADHEPASGPQTEVEKLRIKNKSQKNEMEVYHEFKWKKEGIYVGGEKRKSK